MIATWMLYAAAFGVIVIVGAEALHRGARALRLPTRFVWMAAIMVTAMLPVLLPSLDRPAPAAQPAGVASTGAMVGAVTTPSSPTMIESLASRWATLGPRLEIPLLATWLLLSVVLLGRVVYATFDLWRRRVQWIPREFEGVPVFITPDLGPAVVAIPDSRILLPEWTLALDPAALSTVIRHENEHRAAGDARLILAGSVAIALLPWNPVLWMLRRRLRLAVEMDCDARVLRQDPRVDRYGSLLLAIAQHPRHAPHLAAALTESTSDLERRIEAMTSRPPARPRVRAALFASLALAAVIFACSMPAPDVVAPKPSAEAGPTKVTAEQPLFDFQVERQASGNPSNPPPRYPAQLRAAGIEGSVVAKFVVDTNGKADMRSLLFISSDNDLFSDAVREALPQMKFYPALVGGRKIKQLITMPFGFSLVDRPRSAVTAGAETTTVRPPRDSNTMTVVGVQRPEPASSPTATAGANSGSDRGGTTFPHALATNTPPVYPSQLRAANIEGRVVASFVVLADGTVDMSSVMIEKTDHDAFSAAVRSALPALKFMPGLDASGVPAPRRISMPFVFSLAR